MLRNLCVWKNGKRDGQGTYTYSDGSIGKMENLLENSDLGRTRTSNHRNLVFYPVELLIQKNLLLQFLTISNVICVLC